MEATEITIPEEEGLCNLKGRCSVFACEPQGLLRATQWPARVSMVLALSPVMTVLLNVTDEGGMPSGSFQ